MMVLGSHGFPIEVVPMLPSTRLSFCAMCQVLVQLCVDKVWQLDYVSERRGGGERGRWAHHSWKHIVTQLHTLLWDVIQIWPTKYVCTMSKNTFGHEWSHVIHAFLTKPSNKNLWNLLPWSLYHMSKLGAPKSWIHAIWILDIWFWILLLFLSRALMQWATLGLWFK